MMSWYMFVRMKFMIEVHANRAIIFDFQHIKANGRCVILDAWTMCFNVL